MKPSQILREAARRIDAGEDPCGCWAIDGAYGDDKHHAHKWRAKEFFHLIAPHANTIGVWFGGTWSPINQSRRVIALCLAAAIAESEGQ